MTMKTFNVQMELIAMFLNKYEMICLKLVLNLTNFLHTRFDVCLR